MLPYGPSVFFGMLDPELKKEVMKEVTSRSIQKFDWMTQALEEALSLKALSGSQLLQAYRQRLPVSWAMLQDFDLNEYDRQMREWRHLETQDMRKRNRPATPNLKSPTGASDLFVPSPQEG